LKKELKLIPSSRAAEGGEGEREDLSACQFPLVDSMPEKERGHAEAHAARIDIQRRNLRGED